MSYNKSHFLIDALALTFHSYNPDIKNSRTNSKNTNPLIPMRLKTNILVITLFLFSIQASLSQVGINTTNPQAMFDITASNVATPANTDGIIVPRVDEFPTTDPTAAQNSMLIFATGDGSIAEGFYWWNNSTTSWTSFVKKIDDLSDGKSDIDGSDDGSSIFLGMGAGTNDDASDNANIGIGLNALQSSVGDTGSAGHSNVGIGYESLKANLGRENVAVGFTTLTANTTGNANVAIGDETLRANLTANRNTAVGTGVLRHNKYGEDNVAVGLWAGRSLEDEYAGNTGTNDNNVMIGMRAGDSDVDSENNIYLGFRAGGGEYDPGTNANTPESKEGNIFIGSFAGFNESGNNKLYIQNSDSNATNVMLDNPLIYGEFDDMKTVGTIEKQLIRINGELQVGNPDHSGTGTGYALPEADGTANQILTTDGAGAVTWAASGGTTLPISRAITTVNRTLGGVNVKIVYNNEGTAGFSYDPDGRYTNGGTSRFNVNADGYYRITAMYTTLGTNVLTTTAYGIAINDGTSNILENIYRTATAAQPIVRQIDATLYLTNGTTIQINGTKDVAGSNIIVTSANSYFEVERVR